MCVHMMMCVCVCSTSYFYPVFVGRKETFQSPSVCMWCVVNLHVSAPMELYVDPIKRAPFFKRGHHDNPHPSGHRTLTILFN